MVVALGGMLQAPSVNYMESCWNQNRPGAVETLRIRDFAIHSAD